MLRRRPLCIIISSFVLLQFIFLSLLLGKQGDRTGNGKRGEHESERTDSRRGGGPVLSQSLEVMTGTVQLEEQRSSSEIEATGHEETQRKIAGIARVVEGTASLNTEGGAHSLHVDSHLSMSEGPNYMLEDQGSNMLPGSFNSSVQQRAGATTKGFVSSKNLRPRIAEGLHTFYYGVSGDKHLRFVLLRVSVFFSVSNLS